MGTRAYAKESSCLQSPVSGPEAASRAIRQRSDPTYPSTATAKGGRAEAGQEPPSLPTHSRTHTDEPGQVTTLARPQVETRPALGAACVQPECARNAVSRVALADPRTRRPQANVSVLGRHESDTPKVSVARGQEEPSGLPPRRARPTLTGAPVGAGRREFLGLERGSPGRAEDISGAGLTEGVSGAGLSRSEGPSGRSEDPLLGAGSTLVRGSLWAGEWVSGRARGSCSGRS